MEISLQYVDQSSIHKNGFNGVSSSNFILLVTLWPTCSNNSARYKMAMILEHWFLDLRKQTARACQGAYGELHGKLSISPAPFFVAQLSAMSRLAGLNCPEFPRDTFFMSWFIRHIRPPPRRIHPPLQQ